VKSTLEKNTPEEPKKDSEGQRGKERQKSERERERASGGSLNHLEEKGETDKNVLIERQRRQGERTVDKATWNAREREREREGGRYDCGEASAMECRGR